MTDPMDTPPADHGSDRYDMVEIDNAPPGIIPFGDWMDALMNEACPDCRANVIVRYGELDPNWPPSTGHLDPNGHRWYVAIAHDDTCPTLAKEENR